MGRQLDFRDKIIENNSQHTNGAIQVAGYLRLGIESTGWTAPRSGLIKENIHQ